KEPLLLAFGESLPGPHDPRGDLPRTRNVGPDRFRGARAKSSEVFADDLAAAAVAASPDLQEQPGAADLALGFGEAGADVCLGRIHDAVGAALAGGGQQFVEVGVAETSHGLAVEVQTADDRADRPAPFQQAV